MKAAVNRQRSSFDARVSKTFHLEPIYNICTVSNLQGYQEREHYECLVRIGGTEFISNERDNRKPSYDITSAENLASRNAHAQLQKKKWVLDSEKDLAKQKLIQNNVYKIPGGKTTKEGWQSLVYMGKDELSAIYECGKYMSDEVLAMQFKDIVRLVSRSITHPKFNSTDVTEYTTRHFVDGPVGGYKSILNFNGREFESLGLMIDENQAEQSASEHALRTLGFLPKRLRKSYLIQPYAGGVPRRLPGVKIKRPFVFTSTVLFDILEAFMDSRYMIRPKYFIKDAVSKTNTTEFAIYGEPDPLVDCICSLDGRFFHAPCATTKHLAVQLSANEALKHFGLDRVQERMELRKYIRLNRFEFFKGAKTVYSCRPSVDKGWIWPRFCKPQHYKDAMLVGDFLNSDTLLHNYPCKEYINSLLKKELQSIPAFKGKKLIQIDNVSVAEVDENNPNLFIIGTPEFSIKMLSKEKKIFSKQRECTVEIKPGHNIRKLKCEYRVSLPSLEVHLKAIHCSDVYYSNPPLPVVTSCGVVALFHDHVASPEDVYVLLTRKAVGTTFECKAPRLQRLLHSIITPTTLDVITPAECTEGIEKWLDKEVKLLSEMTMDSLHALMSTCVKYDTRWNELLVVEELPAPLKLVKETCLTELKRREENDVSVVEEQEFWDLPHSDFVTRFDPIGIHVEDSIFCGQRSIAETAGLKLRINDIESCSSVDIPIENDKSHRGGFSRYYIWNKYGEENKQGFVHQRNESPEEKELLEDYKFWKNPKTEHGMRRYRYSFFERIYMYGSTEEQHHLMGNIEYVNADDSRTKYTDLLRYKTNDKELRKGKQLNLQDNDQATTAKDGDSLNRLSPLHLPAGKRWSSYKNSLQLHCKMQRLPVPYYITKQVGTMYRGEVCIGKTKIVSKKDSITRQQAGASAAYTALCSYGYLKGVEFDYGLTTQRQRQQRLKAEAITKISGETTKDSDATKTDVDNEKKDSTLENESLNQSKDADAAEEPEEKCETSGEQETIEPADAAEEPGEKCETSGEQETSEPGSDTTKMDVDNEKKDSTLENESLDQSKDADAAEEPEEKCETSGEQETMEPVDNEEEEETSATEFDNEGEEEETSVMKCEDSAENGREEHVNGEEMEEASAMACEDPTECDKEKQDSEVANGEEYKVVNEWTKSEDAAEESFTVVNEWLRDDDINLGSDEEEGKGRHGRGRKRVYQWADEEDIPADELDTGYKEDEDADDKRKRIILMKSKKSKIRKKAKRANKEPSNEWARIDDVGGFKKAPRGRNVRKEGGVFVEVPREKNQQKQGGAPTQAPKTDNIEPTKHTPDMKKVIFQTAEGTRTVWKRGRLPPLPARDAYRIQCLWMKLDDAMNVCPMLEKISQTSQFKGCMNELIEKANKFMKSKDMDKTVKTTCGLDS